MIAFCTNKSTLLFQFYRGKYIQVTSNLLVNMFSCRINYYRWTYATVTCFTRMHYNYYCHLTDVNDHLSHFTVTTSLSLNCHINFMWLHLNCHIAAVCECIILSHNSDVNEGLSHFSVTKPMSTNAFDCHIINFMWLHQNCHINAFEPIRELHNRMLQTDNWQFQHLRNKTSSRRKFPSKL